MRVCRRIVAAMPVFIAILVFLLPVASAHNVSARDATFVESNKGMAVGPFLYLGAKHMVTGYDHLLFLLGVIFFLYRVKDWSVSWIPVFRTEKRLNRKLLRPRNPPRPPSERNANHNLQRRCVS